MNPGEKKCKDIFVGCGSAVYLVLLFPFLFGNEHVEILQYCTSFFVSVLCSAS